MLICRNLLCQKWQRLLRVERISRQLQSVWEDKHKENSWVKGKGAEGGREAGGREPQAEVKVVAGKGLHAESFQQNLQNKSVGRDETFLQTFLTNHVE